MPILPSGLSIGLSRQYIPAPDEARFPVVPPEPGHFYYWAPDPNVNTPPFEPGVTIIRQLEVAPVPSTHEEVARYIQVLIFKDEQHYYWRGDWLSNFPILGELNEEDQAAWKAWLAENHDFLDETIERCRRQAEAVQALGLLPATRLDPLHDLAEELMAVLAPRANLTNSPAEVRLAFAGARLDLEGLQEHGMVLVQRYDECAIGDIPLDASAHDGLAGLVARCWFSSVGHFRDVRFLGYPRDFKGVRVLVEAPGEQAAALIKILHEGIQTEAPSSAVEDWSKLRNKAYFKKEPVGMSEEVQRASLVEWNLGQLPQKDPHLIPRYVSSILRFVSYWPDTLLLARVANHAAMAALHTEAAALAIETLKRGDLDAAAWNLMGCVCHHLELRLHALRCYMMANQMAPDVKTYRDNIVLDIKPVIADLLKEKAPEKNIGLVVGLAEAVIESNALEKGEDIAFMHGLVAMGCEFFGDDELALAAWERAESHVEHKLISAAAARNRMKWKNLSNRRRSMEAHLISYPDLPEEKGDATRPPVHYSGGDVHGSHWETVVPSVEEFVANRLRQIVAEGLPCGERHFEEHDLPLCDVSHVAGLQYDCDSPIGYHMLVATHRDDPDVHELASSYPVGLEGKSCRLRITSLYEWPEGIEGGVGGYTDDDISIDFFAPYFFSERTRYRRDALHEVRLIGFVGGIELDDDFVEARMEITEGPMVDLERQRVAEQDPEADVDAIESVEVGFAEDYTLFVPTLEAPNEYGFLLPVESVAWFTHEGRRGCMIGTKFNTGYELVPSPWTLYVMEHVLNGYEPKIGDHISGWAWMQGYLVSDEIQVEEDEDEPDEDQAHEVWASLGAWFDPESVLTKAAHDPAAIGGQAVTPSWVCHQIEGLACVRAVLAMPERAPLDPPLQVLLRNGRCAYVHIRRYDMDQPMPEEQLGTWIEERRDHADRMGLTPVLFAHIGKARRGEGWGYEYQGMDELFDELESMGETVPEQGDES